MTINTFGNVVSSFHYTTLSFLLSALKDAKSVRFGPKEGHPLIYPPDTCPNACTVDKVELAKTDIEKDLDGNPCVYVTVRKLTGQCSPNGCKPFKVSFATLSLNDQIHIVNSVLLKLETHK